MCLINQISEKGCLYSKSSTSNQHDHTHTTSLGMPIPLLSHFLLILCPISTVPNVRPSRSRSVPNVRPRRVHPGMEACFILGSTFVFSSVVPSSNNRGPWAVPKMGSLTLMSTFHVIPGRRERTGYTNTLENPDPFLGENFRSLQLWPLRAYCLVVDQPRLIQAVVVIDRISRLRHIAAGSTVCFKSD